MGAKSFGWVLSMITIKQAEFVIGTITFLLAYLIVITFANVFRAWVAKKMGDDTGEQMGFLTLNPLVHIDPIGIICLVVFYFGWGRLVPINQFNIHEPWRRVKMAIVYLSDVVAYLVLGLIGIVALVALFDVHILDIVRYMVLTHNVSYLLLAHTYPAVSSLVVSVGFIIFALIYLSIILSMLNFIINISNYVLFILTERFANIGMYAGTITILLPIILILFFSGLLRLLAVNFIAYVGHAIAQIIGIA